MMGRKSSAGWRETWEGLRYARYVIFHPFKGFWDLKKERRGNLRSAALLLAGLIVMLTVRRQFTGFAINSSDPLSMNLLLQITYVLLPFILWCAANWAITTLVDGEGTFSDIFITTAYALTPVILLNIPMVIMSNVLVLEEMPFYYLLDAVSVIWAGFLIVVGIMTVHQFTMPKTIGTMIIAVVGMAAILVLFLLFFTMLQQMFNFAKIAYFELFRR